MEISVEKNKLITNNTSGINNEIKVNGQKLETVASFQYWARFYLKRIFKPERLSWIAQTTAALTRLRQIGTTGAYLSVPRYDSCAPLSHPSSCMLVNHGPSQQSCEEEYKP